MINMIPAMTICPGCGTENSRFNHDCTDCGNILRDRVANIDLWETLSGIIDHPGETFDKIIFAENKNFTSFFVVFAVMKYFFLTLLFSFHFNEYQFDKVLMLYFQYLLLLSVFLILPLIILKTGNFRALKLKWRDLMAGVSYSYSPVAMSALLLIFFEFIIYGGFLFNKQPSPLDFKQSFGVMFILLEVVFIGWTLALNTALFHRFGIKRITALVISFLMMSGYSLICFLTINYLNFNQAG